MSNSQRAGRLMGAEIAEQPRVVEALRRAIGARIDDAVDRARGRTRFVVYAARGTSDNAAIYGQYLAGVMAGLPASLATPSVTTLYKSKPSLDSCLVFGVSQSGQTPDVAAYLQASRDAGATTVAVTNEPDSSLADVADVVLPTSAGAEKAIPATKTYTSQLAVLLLFWSAWANRPELAEALAGPVPSAMRQALRTAGADVDALASRYDSATWVVTAARGFSYANAREAALKLLEASYVPALSFSVADLWHGPVAAVEDAPLTLLLDYPGPASASTIELAQHLRSRDRAIIAVAADGPVLEAATHPIEVPGGLPEVTSPLVTILPAQLFARAFGLARGVDPDLPRSLSKVTRTR